MIKAGPRFMLTCILKVDLFSACLYDATAWYDNVDINRCIKRDAAQVYLEHRLNLKMMNVRVFACPDSVACGIDSKHAIVREIAVA